MDTTAQDTKQLHRVKRSYTRKLEGGEAVSTKEANVLDREALREIGRIRVAEAEKAEVIAKAIPVLFKTFAGDSPAQVYALRVWSGQSPDLPRAERMARVMAALKGQGLPTDGVVLP